VYSDEALGRALTGIWQPCPEHGVGPTRLTGFASLDWRWQADRWIPDRA
jgi:hypothetical protein